MSRLFQTTMTLGIVAALVPSAMALYIEHKTEEFGPAPPTMRPADREGKYGLRFAPGRRYWLHKNWSGWGQIHDEALVACQGDTQAASEALTAFASLPMAAKEIRLLPAPGLVRSLDGKTILPCDWQIDWTSHVQFPRGQGKGSEFHSARMTLFIARARAVPAPDPRTAGWIKDLNDGRFSVRQRAFQALAALDDAALPAVRQALQQNPSLEQKRRLERLLDRLKSIHLAQLKLPKGIPVFSLDELLEQQRKNWQSGDLGKSWEAAQKISDWAEYSEAALPLLAAMLQDQRDQVRGLAIKAVTRLGKRAVNVLPDLKAAQRQGSAVARGHLRQAIDAIEQAPDVARVEEQWSQNRRLRQDITQFCRSLKQAK